MTQREALERAAAGYGVVLRPTLTGRLGHPETFRVLRVPGSPGLSGTDDGLGQLWEAISAAGKKIWSAYQDKRAADDAADKAKKAAAAAAKARAATVDTVKVGASGAVLGILALGGAFYLLRDRRGLRRGRR